MGEKCERATGKCTNIIHRAAWFRSFHPAPEKRPTFGSPIGCRESWQLTQKAWRTASRWSLRFRDNVLRKRSFSRRYCAAGRRAHKRFTRNSESEGSVKNSATEPQCRQRCFHPSTIDSLQPSIL